MTDEKVAGALFDFLGWLTTREDATILSSRHDAGVAVEVLREWAQLRGLDIEHADVEGWQDR